MKYGCAFVRLDFSEFFDGLWYVFNLWDDSEPTSAESSEDKDKANAKKKFAEIDDNG